MRHAPGAATTVRLEHGDAVLRVAVQNAPPVAATTPNLTGAGYGLTGIRERVRAVGGRMDAASTPDGGYRLAVELPVHVPVRTEPTGGAR
jgi:signal transduction histidine kinase